MGTCSFCVDETNQKRRKIAEMLAAERLVGSGVVRGCGGGREGEYRSDEGLVAGLGAEELMWFVVTTHEMEFYIDRCIVQ